VDGVPASFIKCLNKCRLGLANNTRPVLCLILLLCLHARRLIFQLGKSIDGSSLGLNDDDAPQSNHDYERGSLARSLVTVSGSLHPHRHSVLRSFVVRI